MEIDGTYSGGSSTGDRSLMNDGQLDRLAFLNLLVEELKHQDPLNPMDNHQFLAELAQLSTLEQLEGLNNAVGLNNQILTQRLVLDQQQYASQIAFQATSFIGRTVEARLAETEEMVTGEVTAVKFDQEKVDIILVVEDEDGVEHEVRLAELTKVL